MKAGPPTAFMRHGLTGLLPARFSDAGHDLGAAFALAAVAIPEQMATARLAGLPPATGLLVFVAGASGFFLLGSNRSLSAGADSTIAPIFAGSLALFAAAGSPHYMALATALALLVGAMVGAGGLLRLGWIARLLSIPVITGFLAGIAVHIAVSQLPALLGIAGGHGEFFATIANLARNIAHANPFTLAIGAAVFAIIFGCEKIDIRLPGALIAMVFATLAVPLLGLTAKGVTILGIVQTSSLRPSIPAIALSDIGRLLPVALIVSLVVIIQTAAVSRSFQSASEDADLNRDLVGMGFGNILSGLFGGFPANSSPPRTAIVSQSGGRSRFAGLCAALIVTAFLALGLRLVATLPQAALAGLLLFVAQRIFRFDTIRRIASQSRAELALALVTAAAIVATPIETGVGIGIFLSLLHGVWTIAQTRVVEFEKVPGTTIWWPAGPHFEGERQAGIVVLAFQAPLFFLNAETFRDSLDAAVIGALAPVRAIILEASGIIELDFSGAQIFIALIAAWKEKGVDIFIARLESVRAQQAFEKFGILALLGQKRAFHSVDEAIRQMGLR